ncbi:MAG: SMP-30/gluconolactonase/LRE family protein [Planctomycetota bacterium]
MTKTTVAEVLYTPDSEERKFLPEGPTCLSPGVFSWVAIQHGVAGTQGSLNIFDTATGANQSFDLPGRPGFAKPTDQEGIFIVGAERELGLFNIQDGSWDVLNDQIDADVEGTIINDGTLYGPNVVFGSKDLEFKTQKAGLYLFQGEKNRLIRLRNDQVCSNGKDVINMGEGGCSLIDIDSPTKKVVRYPIDVAAGTLGDPQVVVDLNDLPSVPDGMAMTPDEQSLIVSFYNPNPAEFGETRQYSLYDGGLEHIWQTPGSPQATCPLLLPMPDGSIKLIITTAVEHMPEERRAAAPNAGSLFVAETSFRSPPTQGAFPTRKLHRG